MEILIMIICPACTTLSAFTNHCQMCNGQRACHNCNYCLICKRILPPQITDNDICYMCGETRIDALTNNCILCANCSYRGKRTRIAQCPLCDALNTPSEEHHIVGRKRNKDAVIVICLNCHRVLSRQQETYWPKQASYKDAIRIGTKDIIQIIRTQHCWRLDDLVSGRINLISWLKYNESTMKVLKSLNGVR